MINILFRHDNPVFESRINYVLDFINHHPLADQKIRLASFSESKSCGLSIFYGEIGGPSDFKIPAQKFFFNEKLPDFEQLVCNAFSFNSQFLYSVENTAQPKHHFLKGNIFQFDIIETIFFHISRFEEWHYAEGREDQHGRMDARQQVLVKNQLFRKPVVDDLVFCFLKAIGIDLQNQKTRYRITHDIDHVFRKNDLGSITKSMGGAILKRKNLRSAYLIWKHRKEKNAYDTFEWMLREEEEIEKVIYFLVGGKSFFDKPYDLNLPVIQRAIKWSQERNYQIGIHPSYETWKNQQLFENEWEKLQSTLGDNIHLTRQHYLRFSFHYTPRIIENLGLKEDSSLGFANLIGFRCGTGFGYKLYDFENEKAFDFMETPMIVMDSSLLRIGNHQSEKIKNILATFITANQFNTKITFNFHNSSFYNAQIMDIPLRALYESLFS